MLTKNQRNILEHTNSRAANGNCCGDSLDIQKLVFLGLMEFVGTTGFCPDKYYRLTPAGRKTLEEAKMSENPTDYEPLLTACTGFIKGWPHFLSRINFDASFLDAEAIRFMNEVPGKIKTGLSKIERNKND